MSNNTDQKSYSTLRFLHNVANIPNSDSPIVDIYLNKKSIALNVAYKDFTGYFKVQNCKHLITVVLSGTKNIITKQYIELNKNNTYTVIIAGSLIDNIYPILLLKYQDNIICPRKGQLLLRFIHAAAGAPNVDIYSSNSKIFNNVKYTDTGVPVYITLKPGKYNISVKVAETDTTVVGPLDIDLQSGGIYTIVASGLIYNNVPYLTALLSDDNNNACETLQKNFNVQAYMGKWYQIGYIPQPFGKNCSRQGAQYTLLADKINVFNTCYNKEGQIVTTITGSAIAPNPCNPASLIITFPNLPPAQYLIHKTNYNNYAIVGNSSRTYLSILCRMPQMCISTYNKILRYVSNIGYNPKLIMQDYNTTKKW